MILLDQLVQTNRPGCGFCYFIWVMTFRWLIGGCVPKVRCAIARQLDREPTNKQFAKSGRCQLPSNGSIVAKAKPRRRDHPRPIFRCDGGPWDGSFPFSGP